MIDEQLIQTYLDYYNLRLIDYDVISKIIRVNTNKGVFGIKRIANSKSASFVKKIKQLYKQGYKRIMPLFLTTEKTFGVVIENEFWYLIPWMPDNKPIDHVKHQKYMLQELARIHKLSAKETEVDVDERAEYFENMQKQLEEELYYLSECLQRAEKKWVMSPFEWQYCMYYADIRNSLQFSKHKFELWYDKVKDTEKARLVLIHGKLSLEHFIVSSEGKGYFINMEKSQEASPNFDLLPFFVEKLRGYPKKVDDIIEILNSYLRIFNWREEELLLFMSYLAYPKACVRSIDDYYMRNNSYSESVHCRNLLLNFWQMKNIEYFIVRFEERNAPPPPPKT